MRGKGELHGGGVGTRHVHHAPAAVSGSFSWDLWFSSEEMQGQSKSTIWEASVASWSWQPQRWGELTARKVIHWQLGRRAPQHKVRCVVEGSEDVGDQGMCKTREPQSRDMEGGNSGCSPALGSSLEETQSSCYSGELTASINPVRPTVAMVGRRL